MNRIARTRQQSGFSTVEIGITLAVVMIMMAISAPLALNTVRTYRRDAGARHVLAQIRTTQALATSRNEIFDLQWGPVVGRAADNYRVVRDTTGSCGLPAVTASEDGSDVVTGWTDLGDRYEDMTIQSITDASSNPVGNVMFSPIGAAVNTCSAVTFPLRIVVADNAGRSRTIEITRAGSTRLR